MPEDTNTEQSVENTELETTAVDQSEEQKKSEAAEIEDLREAMKKSDWVSKLVSAKEEKKEEVKDEKKEEGKTEDKSKSQEKQQTTEEKPKKAKQPKRQEEPPRPEIDVGAVAEAAAESAARTVAKMQADKAGEEIPEHIKKREEVYKELEEINPQKYSGVMRKVVEFARREEERADAWEKAHPGEAYDADADEHKQWYDANEPKIDPEDLEDARIAVKANKIIEQRMRPEIEKTRVEVEKTRVEPLAAASAANVTEKVLGAFVPDAPLSRETVKKLIDEDPDAYEIAVQVDNAFRPVASAVPKLYRGIEQFDENNRAHVEARNMLYHMEQELKNSDPDDLNRGGKKWASLAEFYALPANKRSGYWCVSEADIANYVALTAQQEAKKAYEAHQKKLEAYAKRYGWVKPDAAKEKQDDKAKEATKVENTQQKQPQSKSPSVGAAPAVGAKTANSEAVSNDPLQPLWTRMGLPA